MISLDDLAGAKFYFHLIADGNIVHDETGVYLSTHDGVFTEIATAIEDLMREDWFATSDLRAVQVEVLSCHGRPLTSFVLRRSDWSREFISLH